MTPLAFGARFPWYTELVPPDLPPPPGPPRWPALAPVPVLQAPVWERQPSEGDQDHAAFLAWLCGGKQVRDWHAATMATGLPPDAIQGLARRWAWEIRASEWLEHTRTVQREASAPLRAEIEAVQAQRLDAVRTLLRVTLTELRKLEQTAAGTPAPVLEPRVLARFVAVTTPILESLRRQAEGLPSELAGDDGPDYSALTPDELEQMRKLRDKARAG